MGRAPEEDAQIYHNQVMINRGGGGGTEEALSRGAGSTCLSPNCKEAGYIVRPRSRKRFSAKEKKRSSVMKE